jgi:hypothetical protein
MARKRTHLVCQHLERLSAKFLDQYRDIIRERIRGRHGIYALYKNDRLHYVGLAKNLSSRLNAHLRDRHKGKWDTFSVYITIESHHIRELESLLLRIAGPKGNSVTGKLTRSQDLKRELRNEAMRRRRDEFDEMMGKKPKSRVARSRKALLEANTSETALGVYVTKSFEIRRTYKGTVYKARVRKNGWIYYKGHLYASPSLVGKEITGRAVNGWYFWKYQRSPGEWVALRTLRK